MPFRTALSGLNAASADLRVTGNNIANAGTVGFKESRAEFADVFAQSFGGIAQTAVGTGTRLAAVTQQFGQGNIDFTGNNLDLAINGQGFFVLDDGGTTVYSRAGAFQVDRNGFVVNAQGQRLQVFDVNEAGDRSARISPLLLSTDASEPNPTNEVIGQLNLSADAPAFEEGAEPIFSPNNPNSYTHSTSVTVFDSLGTARTASLFFRKEGDGADTSWRVGVTIEGALDGDSLEFFELGEFQFGEDGKLGDPIGEGILELDLEDLTLPNGANFGDDNTISFNLSAITQFGGVFSVNRLNQDGFATGRLDSINVDVTGTVSAQFTNGQAQVLGRVAMASFPNPQGLSQLGDNAWAESFSSGEPLTAGAGEGNLGLVQSGGLETSNVDIAQQLVNLITAQRNFQANAQVISTADTVTQTIINIR